MFRIHANMKMEFPLSIRQEWFVFLYRLAVCKQLKWSESFLSAIEQSRRNRGCFSVSNTQQMIFFSFIFIQ